MGALPDVLRVVQLTGAVYLDGAFASNTPKIGGKYYRRKRRRILQRGREVSLRTAAPALERGKCVLECVQRCGCRAGDFARAEVQQAVT